MIEKTIRDFLISKGYTNVFMEKPEKNIPSEYYLIEKTADPETETVNTATIIIKSIAPSMAKACDNNRIIIAAMKGLVAETNVFSCKVNTSYNYTDTTTKEYRYQAVFEVVYC